MELAGWQRQLSAGTRGHGASPSWVETGWRREKMEKKEKEKDVFYMYMYRCMHRPSLPRTVQSTQRSIQHNPEQSARLFY